MKEQIFTGIVKEKKKRIRKELDEWRTEFENHPPMTIIHPEHGDVVLHESAMGNVGMASSTLGQCRGEDGHPENWDGRVGTGERSGLERRRNTGRNTGRDTGREMGESAWCCRLRVLCCAASVSLCAHQRLASPHSRFALDCFALLRLGSLW